jgi:type I site-specific restriction-modification system R (restriction) subunit/very-short-patch-repair endonuclease
MKSITENAIEESAIKTLQSLAWEHIHGLAIAPEAEQAERERYEQVALVDRLRKVVARLNPIIPESAREQAIQKVLRIYSPDLLHNNETFHQYLVEKIKIPYQQDGYERSYEVALIDFENPENNEFLAVNQFTVSERGQTKRPDIVLFVNGLPLVVIELKNAADQNATIYKAYEQIQTYKATIPSLFTYNAICVISDGMECKAGSVSAGYNRFMTWKSEDGRKEASKFVPQLEVLLKGMLNPFTLLDLVRNFIVFEKSVKPSPQPSPDGRGGTDTGIRQVVTEKKLAAYHQYYAVNKAIESTIYAAGIRPSSQTLLPEGEGIPSRAEGKGFHSRAEGEGIHYRGGLEFSGLVSRARELRKHQTKAEEIFWELVRDRQFLDLKFRRQHQIGHYIADFYCDEKKLVIEFDGEVHNTDEQKKHDTTRDKFLTTSGFKVLRFKNEELFDSPETVFQKIKEAISPSPIGRGQGEGGAGHQGDRKAGIVWHTQGSGKSLSMVFYAGKLVTSPEMQNPTIVVLTDRNDLDDQLFDTFAASRQVLRQEPVQAESREHLKELLKVASGGIVFTTIQKFLPSDGKAEYDRLSDRHNVVVIADEAHRTQYGFEAVMKDVTDKKTKEVVGQRLAYGLAKYMRDALPNATFIGFTGTPIESTDINTPQVFGNYIDRYDIKDAVADGATVKIYYESRLAKVNLDEEGKRLIEEYDAELESDEEISDKQKAKAKWARFEAIVGNDKRLKNLASDIVTHFEERQRVFDGKAMIVTMSRRIAVELYKEIIAFRPDWHSNELTKGKIKVVMTAASSDGPEMAKHHTSKTDRKILSDRMKDPADPLQMVIVRDMWLTGFDVPCLHTMYVDKPMHGHTLMQAIARVNRVFKDKPGGLVVDYLGLASDLKKALSFYGEAGGKGDPTETILQAVGVMLAKFEIVQQMFNEDSKTRKAIAVEEPEAYYPNSLKFNYRRFFGADAKEKLSIILQAEEHILGLEDGKNRFAREVSLLNQAFVLVMPHGSALKIMDDVAFFQAVKARLVKFEGGTPGKTNRDIESAIKQIIDTALSSEGVVDIFQAAGMEKPEISILSEEFLLEVKNMKHQNLALELLRKILNDEIRIRAKKNLVKSKKLLEMLETAIKKYQNNLLTTAQVIQELINLAKEIRESDKEAERLGLTTEEVAFYDALGINDSAVQVLGDDTLRTIAKEIADKVRKNATIDWTIRESARAKLMVVVRRTLNKYGYPPDKQQKAVDTVLKQAELMADTLTEE